MGSREKALVENEVCWLRVWHNQTVSSLPGLVEAGIVGQEGVFYTRLSGEIERLRPGTLISGSGSRGVRGVINELLECCNDGLLSIELCLVRNSEGGLLTCWAWRMGYKRFFLCLISRASSKRS